ncbi:XRE family transcriptional regulator [Staphylococcus hyicus]|uniref:XRE family transcriptional regulator n=1 Tax=Staphylococcus hyicus TaxID=1284 RepID=A0A418JIX7_STAHY|nr:helix-turn-helix transcriptional regulator [Staphylococcus hyicus]MCQ9301296.1 helix-turn-helix domain-containing protein [Staphylococcus hyicus]NJH81887.1 helix-turn-helix domain-containing protein [Staphylococcus hyicus]RIO45700.1 XRE family transcriptional regulator [Staphylococcus hyicus]
MSNFGENLVSLRKSRNLSLVELTNQLNNRFVVKFSKASIDRWEKGTTSPSISHASALAQFFGVTLDELSGREETIAAHFDKENLTDEEMEEVRQFIEFIKNRKK